MIEAQATLFNNGTVESVYTRKEIDGESVLDGKLVNFHSNGAPSLVANIKNGDFHGNQYRYDNKGKLVYLAVYEDGKIISSERF